MSDIQPNSAIPEVRIRLLNAATAYVNPEGQYVLYWMIAARRTKDNFGLQRAIEWAQALKKPLLVFEALRSSYQWNSSRIHGFVIQGMIDNQRSFANSPVSYYPYVEPSPGVERGLLKSLTEDACVVISDDFPCFFLPRMVKFAARLVPTRLELVDSNGLYPMYGTDRVFSRAFDFRRHLQKNLLPHLQHFPIAEPLKNLHLPSLAGLPPEISQRWPPIDLSKLKNDDAALNRFLQKLPVDHGVKLTETQGGSNAAISQAESFLNNRLDQYDRARNEPEKMMTSRLSPYLHFGHIAAHRVFRMIAEAASWNSDQVADHAKGQASGWWGAPAAVESFFDEMITWRELGYNRCAHTDDFDRFESLPAWAQKTLADHENDPRDFCYDLQQFESGQTHDPLWNAAQNQLVTTGIIHNYLRMLWGKKILEWTTSPREALQIMIQLNNKWALDGRNPNSYSGIFWVLGRYDRAWSERAVFGKIRYMSSDNTARKVKVKNYIQQFAFQ